MKEVKKSNDATAFVTYGGSLPEHQWLVDDKCDALIEALQNSKTLENAVFLAAGPCPGIPNAIAFKHTMAEYIISKLKTLGYVESNEEPDILEKGNTVVSIIKTDHDYWGTPEQTDGLVREIIFHRPFYKFGTIHVVITKENIRQLKFVWSLFYHGSAKLEFSGKPSRHKRNFKYKMMEYVRMFNAFAYYAHIRKPHH